MGNNQSNHSWGFHLNPLGSVNEMCRSITPLVAELRACIPPEATRLQAFNIIQSHIQTALSTGANAAMLASLSLTGLAIVGTLDKWSEIQKRQEVVAALKEMAQSLEGIDRNVQRLADATDVPGSLAKITLDKAEQAAKTHRVVVAFHPSNNHHDELIQLITSGDAPKHWPRLSTCQSMLFLFHRPEAMFAALDCILSDPSYKTEPVAIVLPTRKHYALPFCALSLLLSPLAQSQCSFYGYTDSMGQPYVWFGIMSGCRSSHPVVYNVGLLRLAAYPKTGYAAQTRLRKCVRGAAFVTGIAAVTTAAIMIPPVAGAMAVSLGGGAGVGLATVLAEHYIDGPRIIWWAVGQGFTPFVWTPQLDNKMPVPIEWRDV